MHAATADRAEFAPPQPPGQLRALGLAVLAHALLLGALTWGVNWKQQSNELTVEAELWSAVPREAAPKLVEAPPAPPPLVQPSPPAPVPRDADIALAREKKKAEKKAAEQREADLKRLAQEKLDREQKKKAAEEKRKQAQDAQRLEAKKLEEKKKLESAKAAKELEAQRQANLRRIAGMAGASGGESAAGSAQRAAGPSASYAGKVAARVKPNIVFTDDIAGNPMAEVEVRAAPNGTILNHKLVKSSGVKAWDEAVLKAIDKTEKLPADTDGRVPTSLIITFRPKD